MVRQRPAIRHRKGCRQIRRGSHAGRKRLKNLCGGMWFDCPKRDHILSFQRQLLDDGIVVAR